MSDAVHGGEFGDPYMTLSAQVDPGSYYLRQRLPDGRFVEQSLIATMDWRTEVYVLRWADRPGVAPNRRSVSLRMSPIGTSSMDDPESHLIEVASTALADERRVMNSQLEDVLFAKYRNPIAGLVGAHLLILESGRSREGDQTWDPDLLNTVVRNLRPILGDEHPDLQALSLRCTDFSLRTNRPLSAPPMFAHSWQLVLDARANQPSLVSPQLGERLRHTSTQLPFLVWDVAGLG
jgi:hypothetical protein